MADGTAPHIVHASHHPGMEGPLPTVVALHGHGANGLDLLGLAPYLAGGRVLMLCPQAEFLLQPGSLSYTWFEAEPGAQPGRRTPAEFERVAENLQTFVDSMVPRYGGDPQRTVLLGFSQGGTLAYRMALATPDRYRGVAALSTWMPPEAEERVDRDAAPRLPILIQHGTEDPLVAVDRARDSRDRLVGLGLMPDYREYPMAHEIRPTSLGDLTQWLSEVLDLGEGSDI